MQQPAAPSTSLDWRAIGIGVAVNIALGLLSQQLFRSIDLSAHPERIDEVLLLVRSINAAGDLAGGATAAWIANRRGGTHGFVVGVLALLVGYGIGVVMQVSSGRPLEYLGEPNYWIAFLPWAFLGVAASVIAGFVAPFVRQKLGKG